MAKKILPPNDPDRPDWKILNAVLGLDGDEAYTPPADVKEASAMLKNMLQVAFEKNPRNVIHRIGGQQLRRTTSTFRLSGANSEHFADEVASRLENRKGRQTTDKNVTNNAIKAWRPEEGGVVTYMRQRMQFVVGDMISENNPILFAGGIHRDDYRSQPLSMSSLDHILDAGGAELSTSGEFVRQQSGSRDEMELEDAFDIDSIVDEDPENTRAELTAMRQKYDASVLEIDEINAQIDYENVARRVFGEMDATEGEGEEQYQDMEDEDLEALDAEDNQVINGNMDNIALSTIKEIGKQVTELDMTNPNRADIAWAVTALGGENILGELTPEKRVLEMKQVAINMVDNLLAGHEDEELFKEVILDFDPMTHKLSDPEFSDILQEAIKADYRLRHAATADQRQAINPPNELIPEVSAQMTLFEAKEKMDAITGINNMMHGLVKASMDQNSFDPHDPERPDLKLLESIIGEHDIVGFDEASPSQKTYMLAQAHWDKLESQLSELSDHGRDYLQQSIEDFEPSKVSYVNHFRQTLSDMSLDGLLGESPWSAPELGGMGSSYLGAQIGDGLGTDDPDAIREHEKFERRMTRSYNDELKGPEAAEDKNQLSFFDQMMAGVGAEAAPAPAYPRPDREPAKVAVMEVNEEQPDEYEGLFQSNAEALGDNKAPRHSQNNEMEM